MLPINREIKLSPETESDRPSTFFEVIDAGELAKRWSIPKSWILEQTRSRATEPIPCVRLGRYVRFEWDSPGLLKWWQKKRK
jgi:hypothetical protein